MILILSFQKGPLPTTVQEKGWEMMGFLINYCFKDTDVTLDKTQRLVLWIKHNDRCWDVRFASDSSAAVVQTLNTTHRPRKQPESFMNIQEQASFKFPQRTAAGSWKSR